MAVKKNRRLVEWGKNVLIVLLSLSAVYLLGRTQLYTQGALSGKTWLAGLLAALPGQEEPQPSQPVGSWTQSGALRPVRMVVTGPQGNTGVQYGNEVLDPLFNDVKNQLADALAGAASPREITETQFRAALTAGKPGVYLDFLGTVPLPNLAAGLIRGTPSDALADPVRRLFLTASGGEVLLYYINEDTGMYYASKTTADLAGSLAQFSAGVAPNGAAFAFELGETYGALAPYTLIEGAASPQPGRYAASSPVSVSRTDGESFPESFNSLVRSLSFHPQSSSYPSRDGWNIQEGAEKLYVSAGQVTYKAAGLEDPRYPLDGLSPRPQAWELVGSAWAFVDRVLSPLCGEARLYVIGMEEAEGVATIRFGYQLEGAPVLVGGDGYAAEVEIAEGAIVRYELQPRTYAFADAGSRVLPELQATAALEALDRSGSELMLYYADRKNDEVLSADWGVLADF